MTFRQLVWHNVRRNERLYGSYFLSSLFSVFVFFIFALLYFHPQLQSNLPSNSETISTLAKFGLGAAQVVIVVLSIIFLWYSFWNFLKARKRDLAIYLMLGISPKDLRKLLIGENLVVGLSASISGVGLGIIFSKLLLLITENVMHLTAGLNFYVPVVPTFLTLGIFCVLFLLISMVMTLRIETDELFNLSKDSEKGEPVPQARPFISVVGVGVLLTGYAFLGVFVQGKSGGGSMRLLVGCVVFTIIGTFILLQQASVWLLNRAKKKRKNQGGERLLLLTNLIFQMRENAVMYGLIALTATAAFVGIGVTSLLAEYNQDNAGAPTFSYTLYSSSAGDLTDQKAAQKLGKQVASQIRAAGYAALHVPVDYLEAPLIFSNFHGQASKKIDWPQRANFIKASEYQRLAKFQQLPALTVSNQEIYYFADGSMDINLLKALPLAQRQTQAEVQLNKQPVVVKLTKLTTPLNMNLSLVAVVTDAFYEQIQQSVSKDQTSRKGQMNVVAYQEWHQDGALSQKLNRFLTAKQQTMKNLSVQSKYQQWQENRQSNGLLSMIGVLLGTVFFAFASSISSFRLFGQLEKAGKYQAALHLLGVSERSRQRIVTKELCFMYFLPGVVACLHFAVAFWGVMTLFGGAVPIWPVYFKLVVLYFVFQTGFMLVSRSRYLKQLAQRVG